MFQISFAHTQPYWGDQDWLPHHQQDSYSLFRHLKNFHGFQKYIKNAFESIFKTILSSITTSCLQANFTWCIMWSELADGLRYITWWSWAGVYPACPCVPDAATSVVVIPHSKIGISQASVLEGLVPSSWG